MTPRIFFVAFFILGALCFKAGADEQALVVGAALEQPTNPLGESFDGYDQSNDSVDIDDPLEPFNRLMFMLNDFADILILNPMAMIYKTFLPDFVQTGVSNALGNLSEPLNFINSTLQGKIDDAFETLGRFLINSTLGLFGLIDVASDLGLKKHSEDFGQTLSSWGVSSGPYLVLPLLGPSSFRDAIGHGVDWASDPTNAAAKHHKKKKYITIRWSAEALSRRARHSDDIDSLKETSLDFYATIRSLYAQHRKHLINDGRPQEETDTPNPEDYDDAFE